MGVLLLLLVMLVIRLVFGDGSVQELWRLHQQVETQRQTLEQLRQRNQALQAEVADLKKGLEAIEERARSELGMIREGEVFYQFIDPEGVVPGEDSTRLAPPSSAPKETSP
ncbi:MAG TPA: cell division protein FtsB [Gammaproteobacteria bacterium]|jgi:cell division protein FtsB|nr:cell division protein FtsB [Gammaproteobacteria bacterium]